MRTAFNSASWPACVGLYSLRAIRGYGPAMLGRWFLVVFVLVLLAIAALATGYWPEPWLLSGETASSP